MNIWHYIHPHYRYDIQEMKIVFAKQLPIFSISSSYYRFVSHSKLKEVSQGWRFMKMSPWNISH